MVRLHIYTCLLKVDVLTVVLAIHFNLQSVSDVPILLKEGKQQLDILTTRSLSPEYGTCWSNAVTKMQANCRALTQESQRGLALALTDCFLQMSGQGPILCGEGKCLESLTDRQFIAYTEFFTHTQNICYFLQSKLWHEESEKTINKLSSTAFKVSLQLEEAEKSQSFLLSQQRESIAMQENMFEHLSTSKNTIAALMSEFKETADAQQHALSSLFSKLSSLQSWAVGESSWFDSIIFYISTIVIFCFFTSTTRTHQARLPLLIILTFNYCLERYFCSLISNDDDVVEFNAGRYVWIWFLRKTTIVLCFIVLSGVALTFRDYNVCNFNMLQQIKRQNEEIRHLLRLQKRYDEVDYGRRSAVKSATPPTVHSKTILKDSLCNVRELSIARESTPFSFTTNESMSSKDVMVRDVINHGGFVETISESAQRPLRRSLRLQRSNNGFT